MLTNSIDTLSASVVRLETFSGDKSLGIATGFLYRLNDEIVLVTNWHVAAGRDANNPKVSRDGLFCTRARIHFLTKFEDAVFINKPIILDITLNDEDGNALCWFQHPTSGSLVDVAVIKFDWNQNIGNRPINDHSFFERLQVFIGDKVFILGFPWGLGGGTDILPIWKSGIIASIPGIPHNAKPAFLVDAKTFKGMSGSPVVCRHTLTLGGQYRISEFQKDTDPVFGTLEYFCGIYSGRMRDSENEVTDLGLVWRSSLISQIWHHKVLGKVL